jgi:hypothetical protein
MLAVIKRLYIVYLIFLGVLIGYIAIYHGLHPSMIGTVFNVTFIFGLIALLMYFMGRPPKGLECLEKFINATIDEGIVINRRKLRRWISCSLCISGEYLVICTFTKVRESVQRSQILDIYTEGDAVVVEFSGKKWYLSSDDAEGSFQRLQRFLKEDES